MSETHLVGRVFRRLVGPPVEWVGRRVEQRVRETAPDLPEPPEWAVPVVVVSAMVAGAVGQIVAGRGAANPHPAGAKRERASREPEASGERGTTSASDEDAEAVEEALETLGVERPPAPTESEVKAAYRSLVVETHPDQGGDAEAFRTVHSAWETVESSVELSDGPDDDGGN